MKLVKKSILITLYLLLATIAQAQQPSQNIRGTILDCSSAKRVPFLFWRAQG